MSQHGKQPMLLISGPVDVVNDAYYKAAEMALKFVNYNLTDDHTPCLPLWVLFWTRGAK